MLLQLLQQSSSVYLTGLTLLCLGVLQMRLQLLQGAVLCCKAAGHEAMLSKQLRREYVKLLKLSLWPQARQTLAAPYMLQQLRTISTQVGRGVRGQDGLTVVRLLL